MPGPRLGRDGEWIEPIGALARKEMGMSMLRIGVVATGFLVLSAARVADAQTAGPGASVTGGATWGYNIIKRNVLEAAQKMSEADYAFKPVDTVRTFGQLVGHVANAQYLFCAAVKGEASPNQGQNAEKLATKAEIVAALEKAFAYCDGAYGSLTDAAAGEPIKLFGTEMSKVTALYGNIAHTFEHYGNIVTYMRMKGLVPPSTERAQQQQQRR
jgi:uncharacterized damage-inducible protein DinB